MESILDNTVSFKDGVGLNATSNPDPDNTNRDYKLTEVLRPAVLKWKPVGFHWLGVWPYSVRPGGRPEASYGWRAHSSAIPAWLAR